MHYEEVRPYDLLSLLMEVDGLYRAPLYEKTLDEGTVQPHQLQLHQVLLSSVFSSPCLLRFQVKVAQSRVTQSKWRFCLG